MRQNLTIALLAVCATLLAVQVVATFSRPQNAAFGQATTGVQGGKYVMATGPTQSGNEAILYIFDTEAQKLACYTTMNQGIIFKGVRLIKHDMVPDWLAITGNKVVPPAEIEKMLQK